MKNIKPNDFCSEIDKVYPYEKCHLDWDKKRPWTLLFAVILSAQCTDKRVNQVTPKLFADFSTLEDYFIKPLELLQEILYPLGFFRAKSLSLARSAERLAEHYKGVLPDTMIDLVSLSGVGRKTANVVLWNVFGKNEGVVVDTHVGRITRRTGLVPLSANTPVKIEKHLMRILPREAWGVFSHQLVQFGRDTCKAPIPRCETCMFSAVCPRRGVMKWK